MSISANDFADGLVLNGSQFSEPMRVIGNPTVGEGFVLVNLVGTRSKTFRGGVTLTKADLESIEIERPEAQFAAKPRFFKLGLEALRISLAQEYELEAQKVQDLQRRRDLRLGELSRQRSLSLQGVERIGVALALPHPERNSPATTNLKTERETERKAIAAVIAHEEARVFKMEDVQDQDIGFDLRSLHRVSGELRLIEVKGIGAATGSIFLSPNEKRVAEDRRDLYWLYVGTHCDTEPKLDDPIKDPARFPWHEVKKVEHYRLDVNAMTRPMELKDEAPPYRTGGAA